MGTTLQLNPTPPAELGNPPLVIQLSPVVAMSDDQFFQFAQLNRDLRMERNAEGELIIMPPAGSESSRNNCNLTAQLSIWAVQVGTGEVFDSSAGFRLPNGAIRSPDASWIRRSRWETLSPGERAGFAPLCPDFVLELRSPTDNLRTVQAKLLEYIEQGARLGFLIDPIERRVHVYRPDGAVETLDRPETVSGEPVLPGFALDLREIW